MLGAIKRRWKSKKVKVLHKGTTSDLSTSNDNCPSRGAFVELGCEETSIDKAGIKPPSPRQIHPISEKTEVKCTLTNNPVSPQPIRNKKSTSNESSPVKHQQQKITNNTSNNTGAAFIHVNSGRIELVNKETGPGSRKSTVIGGNSSISSTRANDITTGTEKLRRLSGRLRNDTRHSWCGSAIRQQQHPDTKHQQKNGYPLKSAIIRGIESNNTANSGNGNGNNNSNSSSTGRPLGPIQLHHQDKNKDDDDDTYAVPASPSSSTSPSDDLHRTLRLRTILLEERLRVMEGLTGNLANCRIMDKNEYENCMTELTSQVSRAVTLQQLMKTEVEKLQQRVVELETHNNTIASMILPTLMKLEETIGNTNKAQIDGRGSRASNGSNFNGRRSISSDNNNRRLGDGKDSEFGGSSSWKNSKKSKIDYGQDVIPRTNGTCINSNNRSPATRNPIISRQQYKVNNNSTSERERKESTEEERPSLSTPISANSLKAQLLSTSSSSSANPKKSFTGNNNNSGSPTINPGRLSPLSKSESSSISRLNGSSSSNSNNSSKRFVSNSTSKLIQQPGGRSPAKKSSTYSGIPRMSSISNNNNNSSQVKSATKNNGSPLSSPKKSCLPVSNSSPLNRRRINNNNNAGSPSRDLHNCSRLPVLKKSSSSSQKKVCSSSDDDNSKKVPPIITKHVSSSSGSMTNPLISLKETNTTATTISSSNEKAMATEVFPSNSIVLQVEEEERVLPIIIKDEGYSTMSSEALAEQENSSSNSNPTNETTLIINKAEILLNSTKEEEVNDDENDKSQKSHKIIESTKAVIISNHKNKSNNFGMRKSSTVNTFLPIRISNSSNCGPSEQRRMMMLRDERRRHLLIRNHNNNIRNCDAADIDNDNDNCKIRSNNSSRIRGPGGMTPMTKLMTSTSLPSTSTRQKIKRDYCYEAGDEQDENDDDDVYDEEHSSVANSTILWEDSDDSDILFLPLEISSDAATTAAEEENEEVTTNSSSTLVPITSSMSDQSYNSTTTNSTLNGNDQPQQQQQHNYPLRRTKGEEFVALLSSKLVHHQKFNPNGRYYIQTLETTPAEDEIEEKALIEKWMKLEDVRSQVQTEEEWAWDWDGVERTKRLKPTTVVLKEVPVIEIEHKILLENDDEQHQPENFKLNSGKNSTFCKKKPIETRSSSADSERTKNTFEIGSSRTFTRDVVSIIKDIPIDTSTWTKPKSFMQIAKEKSQVEQEKKKMSPKKKATASKSLSQEANNKKEKQGKQKSEKVLVEFEKKAADIDSSLITKDGEIEQESSETQGSSMMMNDGDGSPPPAIEFTPEFYHLVNLSKNYGNALASTSTSEQQGNNNKGIGRELTAEEEFNNQMMDDKISQTDFDGGSLDTLSISSELFSECRNCLELIKRLVGNGSEEEEDETSTKQSSSPIIMKNGSSVELGTHEGSPSTWVSVPKGVSNTEVNRILEILSSSESEDILSPGK